MKFVEVCVVALLAAVLAASLGSTIMAPPMTMFSAPHLSLKNLGFNQIPKSDVGTEPIIYSPQGLLLLRGAELAPNIKPRLMTSNWSESMKGSSINQMFALMANGIGDSNGIPVGHHTGV